MAEEMAMFVDFENLRYGMLNNHGQEPNIAALVEKAKKYGRPSVMRAYADFSEHPSEISRTLQVVGIEAITIPTKRTTYAAAGKSGVIERIKNASDMVLALDAIIEALEADQKGISKVFLLVSGDRDYIKLVTLLKNHFGQKVVIAGVPKTISQDLVNAAGSEDPIDVPIPTAVDKVELKRKIVAMIKRGPSPLTYWSLKIIDQWCQNPKHGIPGTSKDRRDAIGELKAEGVIEQKERDHPKKAGVKVKESFLNEAKAKELKYL